MVDWPPDFLAVSFVWIRSAWLIAMVSIGVKLSMVSFWLEMINGPWITMLLDRDRFNCQRNMLITIESRLVYQNPSRIPQLTYSIVLKRWSWDFDLAPWVGCVLMTGSPLLKITDLFSVTISLKPLFATSVVTSLHSAQLFMQFYLELAGGLKLWLVPLIN